MQRNIENEENQMFDLLKYSLEKQPNLPAFYFNSIQKYQSDWNAKDNANNILSSISKHIKCPELRPYCPVGVATG